MTTEQNKELYSKWLEEAFHKKDPSAIDRFCDPNIVDHAAPPGTPPGIEGVKLGIGMWLSAFPDAKGVINDLIAEGDKVVVSMTFSGTHKGEFMGIPPTDKKVTMTGIEIVRIRQGKFIEHWESFDMFGMMQQLGVVKLPEHGK